MTKLDHVSFSYAASSGAGRKGIRSGAVGEEKEIFRDFSWAFSEGKVTAVTGPSGTGKSTLLKLLTGGEKPSSGTVITDSPEAVMFQEPRLLPWFSAEKNLTVVLGKDSETAARKWLSEVHLEKESGTLPEALSGGMQQRLSLARTLAYAEKTNAPLVILDEPFSALDPELHVEMRTLMLRTLRGRTVILITHDEADAAAADCILELGK